MGSVFFLVSMALSQFMAVDIFWVIGVLGVTIILLTFLGGMEAIIWMDVIQGGLLIGGGVLCVILLLAAVGTPYGPSDILSTAWNATTK